MVTQKKRPRRIYIKEWQEKWGISAETMASRLDIERESYYRLIRELHRINLPKLEQLAAAMGHDMQPMDFFWPPDHPSADSLLRDQPQEIKDQAIKLIQAIRKAS
jgi:hypothetical protein